MGILPKFYVANVYYEQLLPLAWVLSTALSKPKAISLVFSGPFLPSAHSRSPRPHSVATETPPLR